MASDAGALKSAVLERAMRFVEKDGWWQVDTWRDRGIFHGFLGTRVDASRGTDSQEKGSWSGFSSVPLSLLHQVHGAEVRDFPCASEEQADGWIVSFASRHGSFALGIKTADCVPVLLVDHGVKIFSALHCGWRSVVAGIVPRALNEFRKRGSTVVEVAIGPAALACCYEVGGDVAEQIRSVGGVASIVQREGKLFADLHGAITFQLEEEGRSVGTSSGAPLRISSCCLPLCTMCDERFFSHRRQGTAAGRQVSFIGIE